MTIKTFLKKYLLNQTIPNEYLCISKEKFAGTLNVLVQFDSNSLDVTEDHVMLGYKPLIIAITSTSNLLKIENRLRSELTLSFRTNRDEEIAVLKLNKIENCKLNCIDYSLFLCSKGYHKFSSPIARTFQFLRYNLTAERIGNIFLNGNLFNQVKIAYSIPRIVSLVSVSEIDLLNIFPTDMIGPAGKTDYLLSLRVGSKSNNQLKKAGRAVINYIDSLRCAEVYKMESNHMKDMLNFKNFSIENEKSEFLNNPLPSGTNKYFELERIDSFEFGIHEIHRMKILNEKILREARQSLAHIHSDILEWRLRRNIPTEFILR